MTTAAGYFTDTPEHIYVTGKGKSPFSWWGIVPPDGDATPFASAPIGAFYLYKPSETGTPVLFFKVDNNENNDDWASVSIGRRFTGQPMGLLLALTSS